MLVVSNVITWIFCLIILVFFLVFLYLITTDSDKVKKRVSAINKMLSEDNSKFDVISFFNAMENSKDPETKHLSRLFRNSVLKCIRKNDRKVIYCNKGRADEVFNEYSIAKPLFYTRFFIPSALTGLGVLGTFVGLVAGLAGLDTEALRENTTSIDVKSLLSLLDGAGTAFITSVVGILFSLLSNSILAAIQRNIRKQINTLVENIDFKFPPNTNSSDYIVVEEDDSTVQGCIRKLGSDLSEIFIKSTSKMTTDLGREIGRYLKEMDARATDVIVKTLDGLQDRLNEGIALQIKAVDLASQKFVDSIRDATNVVSSKYEDIGRTFNTYASELENDINKWRVISDNFSKQVEHFSSDVAVFRTSSLEDRKSLMEVSKAMQGIMTSLQTSHENMNNNINVITSISKDISNNVSVLKGVSTEIKSGMEGIKNFQPKIDSTLKDSYKELRETLQTSLDSNEKFVNSWIKAYYQTIDVSLDKIKKTIERLSDLR